VVDHPAPIPGEGPAPAGSRHRRATADPGALRSRCPLLVRYFSVRGRGVRKGQDGAHAFPVTFERLFARPGSTRRRSRPDPHTLPRISAQLRTRHGDAERAAGPERRAAPRLRRVVPGRASSTPAATASTHGSSCTRSTPTTSRSSGRSSPRPPRPCSKPDSSPAPHARLRTSRHPPAEPADRPVRSTSRPPGRRRSAGPPGGERGVYLLTTKHLPDLMNADPRHRAPP
jgi:hypothetical protein